MFKGLGVKLQVGRTEIRIPSWRPSRWEIWTSLMNPKLYGFGFWITRDMWVDLEPANPSSTTRGGD